MEAHPDALPNRGLLFLSSDENGKGGESDSAVSTRDLGELGLPESCQRACGHLAAGTIALSSSSIQSETTKGEEVEMRDPRRESARKDDHSMLFKFFGIGSRGFG